MFANGSVSPLGLCEGDRVLCVRSTVAEAFTVLTGSETDENLFVSLLYVLNVVKVASWRGIGGVVGVCAPRNSSCSRSRCTCINHGWLLLLRTQLPAPGLWKYRGGRRGCGGTGICTTTTLGAANIAFTSS